MKTSKSMTKDPISVIISIKMKKIKQSIANAKVISTIKVGNKAHGVVVSRDGKSAYVTNTSDNTISIIDVITQKVTDTVTVGNGPNGISYWFETGGMP